MNTLNINISCPSKTFIVGEYLAMQGGPAIIANTKPRFKMAITTASDTTFEDSINPMSPAGQFIKKHPQLFHDFKLRFTDPHNRKGGFGASSAQYLIVNAFKQWLDDSQQFDVNKIDRIQLLQEYINYAWTGAGPKPSGADLIGQVYGHFTFYHRETDELLTLQWPFDRLAFLIVRTGVKIATHKHLEAINELNNEQQQQLAAIVMQVKTALNNNDPEQFIQAINAYGATLSELNLLINSSRLILAKLKANPHILATKGCGALGADVIFMVYAKQAHSQVIKLCNELRLPLVANFIQLTNGIEIKKESS